MLDLSKYQSVGAALRDALGEFSNELCLIEADREREKERLTYRDFQQLAHLPLLSIPTFSLLGGSPPRGDWQSGRPRNAVRTTTQLSSCP